jgi:2,5-diketo-D-gluconate reductase B
MQLLDIPPLGLGTWLVEGQQCERSVECALELGYRHLDTAQIYRNEGEVGRAVERSRVPREELWITTKVWREALLPRALRDSVSASLERLRTDRVDLLLVHWPNGAVPLAATLGALEAERESGRARFVGVSNFPRALLREACAQIDVAMNQVELHAYLQQRELCAEAERLGVRLTAYSPLARGKVAEDAVLAAIGARYGRTASQVALRWLLERGHVVIPKAVRPEHLRENLGALGFALDDGDRAAIEALDRGLRTIDPPFAPAWDR